LAEALADNPPTSIADGGVIRSGYSPELDELRMAAQQGKSYLASLERRERERTGIRSLRVGFNRVFGYYIEVSTSNLPQVPDDYLRKQTLSTGERFYTPELKEQEARILNAEEQAADLEARLLRELCAEVASVAEPLLVTAAAVAHLDVYAALAEVAVLNRYVRPDLNDGDAIVIRGGRHPVVEQSVAFGAFVPNDTELSNRESQVLLLTGPNMAGKSTYLRQVALIVLLAQIGSFVPADEAQIGLVDRIFTRIGAQDDLTRGESTFMVEMVETAQILHQATARSLIILDEIGRGTSTYDGLAIARAVLEYLHHHPQLGAKTLFATHYHELTALAETLPRLRNYHVAVADEGERMVFRYQVLPGGASKSFGVQVAQLAGLPRPVIERAHEVLQTLEGQARPLANWSRGRRRGPPAEQLPLIPPPSPLLEALLRLDPDTMSPLDALTKLYELRAQARSLSD
jgi:DNA mismatch repair protein MutS